MNTRRAFTWIGGLWRDLVITGRATRKTPLFYISVTLTLALGIGANTAIFTLLYGLVLRSLPVERPWRLARVSMVAAVPGNRAAYIGLPYRMWQQLRHEQSSFRDVSAWSFTSVTTEDNQGTLRLYEAMAVSGNAFPLLGVQPYLGRLIAPADDVRGGPPEGWPVVVSYAAWNDLFHADPRVIGGRITLSQIPLTIAGVTPPGFEGIVPGMRPKFYLPLQFISVLLGRDALNTPDSLFPVQAIARLNDNASLRQANAELAVRKDALFRRFLPPAVLKQPLVAKASLQADSARAGLPFLASTYERPLLLLQALVAVVLLLCCVNVAGLMLSKIHARQHEFAVRSALGAGRWRIVRQYFTESFALALAGALLGGAGAWTATASLLRFFVDPNSIREGLALRPDNAVLAVSVLSAVLATVIFGTVPAWRAARSDPGTLLKSRTATGTRRQWAGRIFVPVQVALSLVLVVAAALLSESLVRIRAEHAGFEMDHVTINTPQLHLLPQRGNPRLDLYQSMVDRLEQMPGIHAAAITWYTPMTSYSATSAFQAVTSGPNPPEDTHMAYNDVGPGYFRTMQTRILSGREFQREERDRSVCLLNQAAARMLFPDRQPIGQYVRSMDAKEFPEPMSCRVIGIAEDAKYASMREPAPRTIYFPMNQETMKRGNMVFLMRSKTEAEAIAGFRKVLAEFAPTTPLVRFATLRQQMDDSLGAQRLMTLLSNVFAGLALLLSALGLYGLLASNVAQRTGEIGVRLALGAQRGSVLGMILGDAVRVICAGFVLGAAGLWVGLRFIQGMLFGVSALDPITLAGAAATLAAVGLLAALVPARRAASVDPIDALRME